MNGNTLASAGVSPPTIIQNVATNTVKSVGELRTVLENFGDNCPLTELSIQFTFPEGKGLLKIISK